MNYKGRKAFYYDNYFYSNERLRIGITIVDVVVFVMIVDSTICDPIMHAIIHPIMHPVVHAIYTRRGLAGESAVVTSDFIPER